MMRCRQCFQAVYYSWWWFAYCLAQIVVCTIMITFVAINIKDNAKYPLLIVAEFITTGLILFDIVMIILIKGSKVWKRPIFIFEIIISALFIGVLIYMGCFGFTKSYDELDYALAGGRYAVQVLRLLLYIYKSYKLVKYRKSVKTLQLEDQSENLDTSNPKIKQIQESFFEEVANKQRLDMTKTTVRRPTTKEHLQNGHERNYYSVNA